MSFTTITLSHTFTNLDGSAASGTVSFRLSSMITNGATSYDDKVPLTATLDGSGVLSVALPANNDPSTIPTNTFYEVTFTLNGATNQPTLQEFMIMVPYDAAGGTIDLSSLVPKVQGDGETGQ